MMKKKLCWLFLLNFMNTILVDSARSETAKLKPNTLIYDKLECSDERLQQTDKNIVKMIGVGRGGRLYPTTKNEVKQFCKETDDMIDSIIQFFDDCLPEEPRRVAKIYFYSTRKSIKPICNKKKTKKQQIFLNSAQCINKILPGDICLETFVNKTKALIPYKIGREKIKYACCRYVDLLKCAEQQLTIQCMNNDGREVMMDLIRGIGGDVSNLACGEYNESTDRCDTLSPLPKSKFDKSFKMNYQTNSFVFAQVQMLESIGDSVAKNISHLRL